MNRKSLVLLGAALLVWALVALRFTRLTRDVLPTQANTRSPLPLLRSPCAPPSWYLPRRRTAIL